MRPKIIPTEKACRSCSQTLPASQFYPVQSNKDGLMHCCKDCARAASDAWKRTENGHRSGAQYRAEHRELCNARVADWAARNPDRKRATNEAWLAENIERKRKTNREWQIANPDKECAKQAKRRAARMQACPPWADLGEIGKIYAEAQRLSRETGIKHHVDHIYPLQSKVMCGLHIARNLQVLPDVVNWKKHNHIIEMDEMPRCCAWPPNVQFERAMERQ
jgi:hypothetical protein